MDTQVCINDNVVSFLVSLSSLLLLFFFSISWLQDGGLIFEHQMVKAVIFYDSIAKLDRLSE